MTMAREQLDATALARFRRDPIAFIESVLRDPETGEPFVLSNAEREFLQHAFTLLWVRGTGSEKPCLARGLESGLDETTNLGVRSSNLFGRAIQIK